MTEWQPIETCPKDGEWFDLWAVCRGQGQRFTNVEFVEGGRFFVNDGDPGYLSPDSWRPTHWMPLPTPPKG